AFLATSHRGIFCPLQRSLSALHPVMPPSAPCRPRLPWRTGHSSSGTRFACEGHAVVPIFSPLHLLHGASVIGMRLASPSASRLTSHTAVGSLRAVLALLLLSCGLTGAGARAHDLELLDIPAGVAHLGALDGEADERPLRQVPVPAFRLMRT